MCIFATGCGGGSQVSTISMVLEGQRDGQPYSAKLTGEGQGIGIHGQQEGEILFGSAGGGEPFSASFIFHSALTYERKDVDLTLQLTPDGAKPAFRSMVQVDVRAVEWTGDMDAPMHFRASFSGTLNLVNSTDPRNTLTIKNGELDYYSVCKNGKGHCGHSWPKGSTNNGTFRTPRGDFPAEIAERYLGTVPGHGDYDGTSMMINNAPERLECVKTGGAADANAEPPVICKAETTMSADGCSWKVFVISEPGGFNLTRVGARSEDCNRVCTSHSG